MTAVEARIWVVVEHSDGAVRPVTYEATAFADLLAKGQGTNSAAVVVGSSPEDVAAVVSRAWGRKVYAIESVDAGLYNAEVYRACLKRFFAGRAFDYVVIPHTATGWDFAPGLTVDLGASLVTAVSGYKRDDRPAFARQICNGKLMEDVTPPGDRPTVLTVMPGVFPAQKPDSTTEADVETVVIDAVTAAGRTIEILEAPEKALDLQKADVIVAVGRGLGDPKHLAMIEKLAAEFHKGAVGASRPLCDMGWLAFDAQVGQTGQTVAPKLYLACGISGAVQHTMGMRNSKFIISVNTDRNALFCRTAHYCVPADLHAFVPALIDEIRRMKD